MNCHGTFLMKTKQRIKYNLQYYPTPQISAIISMIKIHFLGSRETAFISAIQNAALTYVVTVGCSSGYLPECSCDLHRKGKENQNGNWRWGGCR